MKSIGKYIIEVLVIIFSVLVAFWVESYRDDLNDREEVSEALIALHAELKDNQKRLNENAVFFNDMATAFSLIDKYSEDGTGLIRIRQTTMDSLELNEYSVHLDSVSCINQVCLYKININFDYIPDLPVKNNIWRSISNSQTASKIDFRIMATAADLYNSWSVESIERGLIEYNNYFIGSSGDLDVIPPPGLFYRLRTLHNVALANFDNTIPEFESNISDFVTIEDQLKQSEPR